MIFRESCDDREFREVVGIGVSKDRYKVSENFSAVGAIQDKDTTPTIGNSIAL